jgi:signal transduction histidine kinase
VGAVERIDIEFTSDTTFLPYRMVVLDSFYNRQDHYPTNNVMLPLRPGVEGKTRALYSHIHMPHKGVDQAFTVDINAYPPNEFLRQAAIHLHHRSWQTYHDSTSGMMTILVTGYMRDSAWVYEVDPLTSDHRRRFLMTGVDTTGDGDWQPEIYIDHIDDFDGDGVVEALLFVNPRREAGVRTMFCLELGTLEIQWSLPMACGALSVETLGNGSLMMACKGPYQGKKDANFDDRLGYLVIVDSLGRITLNRSVKAAVCATLLLPAPDSQSYYLSHEFPPSNADSVRRLLNEDRMDEIQDGLFRLSQVSPRGEVIRSVSFAYPVFELTTIPYGEDGAPHIYTWHSNRRGRIYDTTLALVAETEREAVRGFYSPMTLTGGQQVLPAGKGLYSTGLEQLASYNGRIGRLYPILYDSSGHISVMLLTSGDESAVVRFERRGWVDIATIFYYRYRSYILMIMTALLVGLVLVNYYRQRTRRNLVIIRDQKERLEQAQRELKEAQAKLVAQEKFRQARDIAGGFAHEIRNALSPARHALARMMGLPREKLTEDKLKRMGGLMDRSLVHAVDLTERISEYTRIEELTAEESVDLVKVRDRVLEDHRHQFDDSGIELVSNKAGVVEYRGNPRHFELLLANLVRNAIVAMHESEQRRLTVSVEDTEGRVVIEVSDTGCGIRHEEHERIWDIFYTTDPDRGTGVGLTLTKKIVDLYEGAISVTSEPGKGTMFRVELPR